MKAIASSYESVSRSVIRVNLSGIRGFRVQCEVSSTPR
jgi:hypothetical protein